MGLVNTNIQLRNVRIPALEPVEVETLADSGRCIFACLNTSACN
jgi:hypothetical protein